MKLRPLEMVYLFLEGDEQDSKGVLLPMAFRYLALSGNQRLGVACVLVANLQAEDFSDRDEYWRLRERLEAEFTPQKRQEVGAPLWVQALRNLEGMQAHFVPA